MEQKLDSKKNLHICTVTETDFSEYWNIYWKKSQLTCFVREASKMSIKNDSLFKY